MIPIVESQPPTELQFEASPIEPDFLVTILARLAYPGTENSLILHPLAVEHVDRDIVSALWDKKRLISSTENIYSGVFDGDMIEWRIRGLDDTELSISWFCEDVDGFRIAGPSGTGVNYWQISNDSDANDPADDKWLKWNPGKWKIICNIDGQEFALSEFDFGWRTRTLMVIGQIVPTTTHDPDKPSGGALLSWAGALADDFSYGIGFGGTGTLDQAVFGLSITGFEQVPTKATEAWMGYWSTGVPLPPGGIAPPVPPASIGPLTSSLATTPRGALGSVLPDQRYWMIQHLLNVNDDETSISADLKYPQEMSVNNFATAYVEEEYRILHRFTVKFFLDESGAIDLKTVETLGPHFAKNGPTKLKIELAKGELGTTPTLPSIDVPPTDISIPGPSEPSEPSPHNKTLNFAADRKALSSYASARIGLKGQRGSYRLFGKDAPWIFSEVIFEVKENREIQLKVGTSVTTEWTETDTLASFDAGGTVSRAASAPATTPGLCPFNNLNIYDFRPKVLDDPSSDYVFSRRANLLMEGHVKCFVESSSGAWPEPPTTPSVK